MADRPKIGITMRLEHETRRFYLGRDYSEAIEAAGGLPVHLPLIAKPAFIDEVVAELDGILLPGSDTDVDPAYYGEDPHPRLKKVVPEKDETEFLVIDAAERLGLPVLAICYGMQALNVYRKGSLYQDIETQFENSIKHEQGIPLERSSHDISVEPGSVLARLIGGEQTQIKAKVNSHHHQGVKRVGNDLAAIAWANDKMIEGIQDTREGRYVLGLQWHPELSWHSDKLSFAIFDDFIKECSRRRRSGRSVNSFSIEV